VLSIALLYACNDNFISEKRRKAKAEKKGRKQNETKKQNAFEKQNRDADTFAG